MAIERNDPQHPAGGAKAPLMPGAVPAMSAEATAEENGKQRMFYRGVVKGIKDGVIKPNFQSKRHYFELL